MSLPIIDMEATGKNIVSLQKENGLVVKDLQRVFGFRTPQAIYKWQRGKSLPTLDNLLVLAQMFKVPIEAILVIK